MFCRRHPFCFTFGILVLLIIVIASVTICLHLATSKNSSDEDDDNNGLQYGPTDTRIVPFSNTFCKNLNLSANKHHYDYNSSLYLLRSPPNLTGHEIFSFSKQQFFYAYYYWWYRFFMHPGSHFTVSACYMEFNSNVNFYLIKGRRNFKNWKAAAMNPPNTKRQFKVVDLCSNGTNTTRSFKIHSKDDYFLIFFFNLQANLNTHWTFYRTHYEFSNSSVIESCTLLPSSNNSLLSCSVGVPLSTGNTALLTVKPAPSTTIDWSSLDGTHDVITLDTDCFPRIWMYVVIASAALIGFLLITTGLTLLVHVCLGKDKRANTQASNDTSSAQLLVDPSDYKSEQIYAGGFEAPPKYDES